MPAFPHRLRPLIDGSVVLRLGAERDIPEVLIAYEDDPQLHLRLGMQKPPTGAELGRRAERDADDRAAGRGIRWAVVEPGSETCRGEVNVHHVDWQHQRADLGIWLAPGARGQGVGRRALRLASAWLLTDGGFERVQLLTAPDNEPMLHAAAASGFTYEAVLRGYQRERGSRVDCAVLSLVRGDLST